ncbi:MAG: peptidoglycan bridge formation glycyltransferase FemA/FemB family protein [Chloroflexi bacterium]|nr:MAG: peptidoglycan bridge formation glycyltransferase FemA/FemB family protein [Chloroflexota bacterium]
MHRIIEPTADVWDTFVRNHPRGHVLQLSAWGALKTAYGWQSARVALEEDGRILGGAQILFRPMPSSLLGTLAYLPMGPYIVSAKHEDAVWEVIHRRARRGKAKFLKWEPGIFHDDEETPDFKALGFRSSPQSIQPPRTILIDVRGDDEMIMARMNQGTRRKIRKSLKSGIRYYEGTQDDVAIFTDMMQTTGSRNQFGVHEAGYYELAYQLFVPQGDAVLIMAEHEGDPLAGIMVFGAGKTAWYLYGASSSVKRNLMATYGVQWRAIEWARSRGYTYYDMWGVPDEDPAFLEKHFQERSDGLWGVYGFKRGWGGEVVRSAGTWDRVYDMLVYAPYFAVRKLLEQR